MSKYCVITAAGGNATAFKVVNKKVDRNESIQIGRDLLQKFASYNIEQTATAYIPPKGVPHCEMSGGEFCGNAARAMAVLLHKNSDGGINNFTFTMSGISYPVEAVTREVSSDIVEVTCKFKNLSITENDGMFFDSSLKIVDLDGIVHVIQDGKLPENYKKVHSEIVHSLGLEKRDAVGVIWVSENSERGIEISPIVWVREIDTLFFEGSCGSGSIATAIAKGQDEVWITQPTGKSIFVKIENKQITLASSMEVLCYE